MIELAKQLVELKKEKRELDKEIKACNDHIKDIEAELSSLFVEAGVNSVGVDKFNVILVEKKRASCDQSSDLVQWAEENGAEIFNKPINVTSLTSYVNRNPECISEIAAHVQVTDIYSFQVRKK